MPDFFLEPALATSLECEEAIHIYHEWGSFNGDTDRYGNPVVDVGLILQFAALPELVDMLCRCHRLSVDRHRTKLYPETAVLTRLRDGGTAPASVDS
ncbi:hypothetical protein IU459_36920 [Nocardia amamiensis]|uniref:Uncharacterized protein n=1 Tax=Nocardia amamiensis TaxID=404578 RepID=A0ABS0D791_9NOCA|nr:hypothetical protein [Nocardia amamiensis]MBF6303044.1 hypothetical protein [Nocardia amamiensis]